jgi:hypothetical protein
MPRNPEVDAFLANLADHPLKAELEAVRSAILSASPRIEEGIKWKSPTFMYRGNMASIDPRSKKHVLLMFHTGAEIDDPEGVLEGESNKQARYVRFVDAADVKQKRRGLQAVVRAWVKMKEGNRA